MLRTRQDEQRMLAPHVSYVFTKRPFAVTRLPWASAHRASAPYLQDVDAQLTDVLLCSRLLKDLRGRIWVDVLGLH